MLLNYQYRVYFHTNQKLELNSWLRVCRHWYNKQLGDRFDWYEHNRNSINVCPLVCSLPQLRDRPDFYSQKKQLPIIKEDLLKVGYSGELLDYKRVPSQTLQDVSKRVANAFSGFLKGDCNGTCSGKPRFKSAARYRTLRIEGQAISVERIEKDWLFLSISKLDGWIKVRLHRPLPDGFILKNALLTKSADGWYITICLEDPSVPIFTADDVVPTWDNTVGLDAVLHEDDYLATSQNTKLPALKSFRKSEKRLAKVSKRKASKKKGSRARLRNAKREAREHQRIARSRRDHAFKTAHQLVKTGKKVFIHEDLNLKALSKRNKAKLDVDGKYLPNGQSAKSGLNKSWADAAFGQFFTILEYIAAKAGARTIAVNPAYTSQLLAYRDEFIFTNCDIRSYWDEKESLLVDRDVNASINIKRVGLGLFPTIKRRRGNPVVTNSTTNSTLKEVLKTLRACQKPTPTCTQAV
ncbi:transposase [Scytonema sp. HK-05]|uniref:RNA-guided endonuclease InsQ/TnpB family protein n=1 Tax=Scytonema sp. HK-05 TaxID=1137095 RepID=UPI0009372EEC|nr:RNA-guided endonuclease TnpB family protein [Scytonema sp. HK-05]OKH57589.1 transposase [Scytonema sp. HK-05]BAY44596.1 transposase [Scytonema sp. HK-05]